jgi:hypothetical protein
LQTQANACLVGLGDQLTGPNGTSLSRSRMNYVGDDLMTKYPNTQPGEAGTVKIFYNRFA